MFCTHCGEPLVDGARFCKACGKAVRESAAVSENGQKPVIETEEAPHASSPSAAAQLSARPPGQRISIPAAIALVAVAAFAAIAVFIILPQSGLTGNGALSTGPLSSGGAEGASALVAVTPNYPVKDVAVSNGTAVAVTESGELWVWGNNDSGQLGNGSTSSTSTPMKLMDDVASADVKFDRVAVLKEDGSLWMWGNDRLGEVGGGRSDSATNANGEHIQTKPLCVLEGVSSFDIGPSATGAIKDDGTLWMWGSADRVGNGGAGNDSYHSDLTKEDITIQTTPVEVLGGVRSVEIGSDRVGAIQEDGGLMMWGSNGMGALGIGGMEPAKDGGGSVHASANTPVRILDNVVSIQFEMYGSAALTSDGKLYAWGWNDGAMGPLTKDQYGNVENIVETPRLIAEGVKDFSYKYDGANGFAILKSDDSLWMCGSNSYGEAGVGNNNTVTSPVKVLDGVAEFEEGNNHTAAVKKDGTLWMWGCADQGFPSGVSSNGVATYGSAIRTTPIQVMEGVSDVSLIDTYPYCRVAVVKEDGSMWSWGANYMVGQLGYGSIGNKSDSKEEKDPVKVLDNVNAIKCFSFSNTAVISGTGELLMWGDNRSGQLGADIGESSQTPVSPLE